jgi:hypothetical protein
MAEERSDIFHLHLRFPVPPGIYRETVYLNVIEILQWPPNTRRQWAFERNFVSKGTGNSYRRSGNDRELGASLRPLAGYQPKVQFKAEEIFAPAPRSQAGICSSLFAMTRLLRMDQWMGQN